MAIVALTEETVRWSDFFARGHPKIPRKVSFDFDRPQYEAALASIVDAEIEPLPPAEDDVP
jgi:hypothetical protein